MPHGVSRKVNFEDFSMKKSGFTLLEVLVVIVVISILATLVTGAASYALRVSREKRVAVSVKVLETAITRYWTEYNEWPGLGAGNGKKWVDKKGFLGSAGDKHEVFIGAKNKFVFGPLRVDSAYNSDRIRFLDETAFFSPGSDGLVKFSETTGDVPLAFLTRSGRKDCCYAVDFNYDANTVSVFYEIDGNIAGNDGMGIASDPDRPYFHDEDDD